MYMVDVYSLAGSILGTAVVVAGKAASAAYSTAKDVYYTLQARNAVTTSAYLLFLFFFCTHFQHCCIFVQMACGVHINMSITDGILCHTASSEGFLTIVFPLCSLLG